MTEYIYEYPSGISLKVVGNFPGFFSAKLKLIRPIGKMHNNIFILYMYSCYTEGFFPSFQYQKVFVLVVSHAVAVFESSRKTGNGSHLQGISG